MVHLNLPPLFGMGAEADMDQGIHPEVPDMVHLNPPQLLMHVAEEGAVQRVHLRKHQGQLMERFHWPTTTMTSHMPQGQAPTHPEEPRQASRAWS